MEIEIAGRSIGDGYPCFVVAEIGINHNGKLDTALDLVDAAKEAGADAVKFQKRTVELVYTPEELARPRASLFGTTNSDLKRGLELSEENYEEIADYCYVNGMVWFASAWDVPSVKFLNELAVDAHKVASAKLTDYELLAAMAHGEVAVILSTGMSTEKEVCDAVRLVEHGRVPIALLACTAAYPAAIDDLHLERIRTLREKFTRHVIGYSGHEVGVWTTLCAVAMGAQIVERHITLDRSMWGSDQAASLEPAAFAKLVQEIRDFERARGSGALRCLPCEEPQKAKLRK